MLSLTKYGLDPFNRLRVTRPLSETTITVYATPPGSGAPVVAHPALPPRVRDMRSLRDWVVVSFDNFPNIVNAAQLAAEAEMPQFFLRKIFIANIT